MDNSKKRTEEVNELIARTKRAQAKIDDIMEQAEAAEFVQMKAEERLAEKDLEKQDLDPVDSLRADGYNPDAALEALQILASSVIVEEVKAENLRLALNEIARRFEALDDWMTGGGGPPSQWTKMR